MYRYCNLFPSDCYHPTGTSSSSPCPLCGVAVWTREVNLNRQLNNIVSAVTNIQSVLGTLSKTLNLTETRTQPSIGECTRETSCDLLDVINKDQVEAAISEGQLAYVMGSSTCSVASGRAASSPDLHRLRRRVKRATERGKFHCSLQCHISHVSNQEANRGRLSEFKSRKKICSTSNSKSDIIKVHSCRKLDVHSSSVVNSEDMMVIGNEVLSNQDLPTTCGSQSEVDIDLSGVTYSTSISVKLMEASTSHILGPS